MSFSIHPKIIKNQDVKWNNLTFQTIKLDQHTLFRDNQRNKNEFWQLKGQEK